MVTLPINTSSASSLHLLSSSPLTIKAKAPSAKPDILSILYEAATMDPPTANIASSHNHDGGMERSQKRTKRRLCQVRFDNKISGKKLAPFSAEERRGIYYNKRELDHINRNLMKDVRQMRRSDRSVCKRGIEHLISPDILRGMQQEKEGVIKAVLSEQKRQRTLDIHDPQRIALISSNNSAGAKKLAHVLASR